MSNNQVFNYINVYPNYATGHFIQWKLNPWFNDTPPYNFTLEASETEVFSEFIYPPASLGDVFCTIDDTGLKQNVSDNYFYRVKLDTGSGATYYSSVVQLGLSVCKVKGGYHKLLEMNRIELLLQKFSGKPYMLLKRKVYGIPDVPNIDPVSGVPLTNSTSDFGTGFVGGYFPPIPFMGRSVQRQSKRELSDSGNGVEENQTRVIRKIGFPIVADDDVIADVMSNLRFQVRDVTDSVYPASDMKVAQVLTMSLIPPSDSVYKIQLTPT